jgi:hypothetical protein
LTLTVGATTVCTATSIGTYGSANKSTWKWAFTASTGGANDNQQVDNVKILAYNQYEYSADGTNWQTSNSFSKSAGTYAMYIRNIGNYCPVSLGNTTLTDPPKPTLTLGTMPTVCYSAGSQTASIPYSSGTNLTASGNTYSIDFTSGITDITNAAMTNATSGNLSVTVNAALSAGTYNGTLTIKNGNGCVSTNYSVSVAINATSAVGAVSGDQTICRGTSPAAMTIASKTGTAQWQWATDYAFTTPNNIGTDNLTLTGATVGNLTATRYFRAVVTSGVCTATTSGVITVNVNAPSSIVSATASSSCTYSGTNLEKYISNSSNEALVSLNEGSLNIGTVSATVTKTGSVPTLGTSASPSCSPYTGGEYYLDRKFVITTTQSYPLSSNVQVSLYFTQAELDALSSATASASAAYKTCYGTVNSDGSNLMLTIKHTNNAYQTMTQGGGGLTLTANTPFSGVWKATFSIDRFSDFYLHGNGGLYSNNPLPVTLLYLTATGVNNNYIQLDWATATEINNKGFEVERSIDGENFTKIGWVEGNGTTTQKMKYSYDDKDAIPNRIYYYRLKQIDNDGQFEYTYIVSAIIREERGFEISELVPNPAQNKVNIYVSTQTEQTVKLKLTDLLGQEVMSREWLIRNGTNSLDIDLTEIPSGTYSVSLISGNAYTSKKLVITK